MDARTRLREYLFEASSDDYEVDAVQQLILANPDRLRTILDDLRVETYKLTT